MLMQYSLNFKRSRGVIMSVSESDIGRMRSARERSDTRWNVPG